MRWLHKVSALGFLILTILTIGHVNAQENVVEVHVNTTAMQVKDDGFCTLPEAINAANTHVASGTKGGECKSGAEETVIILEGDTDYFISEPNNITDTGKNGLPVITSNIMIRSNNNLGETVISTDVAEQLRHFEIAFNGHLNLQGISLKGGLSKMGGAIYNQGNLYLQNVEFISNSASEAGGAIYNLGTVEIIDTQFHENNSWISESDTIIQTNLEQFAGGGLFNGEGALAIVRGSLFANNNAQGFGGSIFNMGNLIIYNTEFWDNNAQQAGAIYNFATLHLDEVEIHDNKAVEFGGSLVNAGNAFISNSHIYSNHTQLSGGAIYNYDESLLAIKDTIIENNTSDRLGGGVSNSGLLILTTTTITANEGRDGGGIYCYSGAIYTDNISNITENDAINGSDFFDCAGYITHP